MDNLDKAIYFFILDKTDNFTKDIQLSTFDYITLGVGAEDFKNRLIYLLMSGRLKSNNIRKIIKLG